MIFLLTCTRPDRAWPRDDVQPATALDEPIGLESALTKQWDDDRHTVQYAPVRIGTHGWVYRLSKAAVAQGTALTMQLLIFDLDDPVAHAAGVAARGEWRKAFRARLPEGWCAYDTFGGGRIVFRLAEPITVASLADWTGWSAYYETCVNALRRVYGLDCDGSCKDPVRLFRLPRAYRDEKMVPANLTTTDVPAWDDSLIRPEDEPVVVLSPVAAAGAPATVVDASLQKMVQSVLERGMGPGKHNAQAFSAAGLLARYGWAEDAIFEVVGGALDATGGDSSEDEHSVRNGIDEAGDNKGPGWPRFETDYGAQLKGVMSAILTPKVSAPVALFDPSPPSPEAPPTALAAAPGPDEQLANWRHRLQLNENERPLDHMHNLLSTLDVHPLWAGVFGFDAFTNNVILLRDMPSTASNTKAGATFNRDYHPTLIRAWLNYHLRMDPSVSDIISAVVLVATQKPFHQVQHYLNGLRGTWDGRDRNLSVYLGAPQEGDMGKFNRGACSKWLRSAVARAMKPGAKTDSMLILQGKQGWSKSTVLRNLCPEEKWFYEATSTEVGSKDFLQQMRGKWLAEIPEVDRMITSRDESDLKALLSAVSDTYRPSYAHEAKDFPRQIVFAGTTNRKDYLRDETGNRRYWPVDVGDVRADDIKAERDQLWAQALQEWEDGAQWWLTAEEVPLQQEIATDLLETDPWEDMVLDWLAVERPVRFTTLEALGGLPGAKVGADIGQREKQRMGKILRKLGWDLQKRAHSGRMTRFWVR